MEKVKSRESVEVELLKHSNSQHEITVSGHPLTLIAFTLGKRAPSIYQKGG